jgi:hypothetical protein
MLNALCIRDGFPFSRVQMRRTARGVIPSGPALHRGQCRSISPSIASSCRLGRQIAVLYWTVLRKIFLAGQRHFLRSVHSNVDLLMPKRSTSNSIPKDNWSERIRWLLLQLLSAGGILSPGAMV